MKCNICGSGDFGAQGKRHNVRCINCGSLERTRLLWLYLESIGITHEFKILHIAPELGIYQKIKTLVPPENYIVADYDPNGYKFADNVVKIDLCKLDDWPTREFDLIIHSHVLEHTTCSVAYSLFHIHRMLKDEGHHICIIPFVSGGWEENFENIGDQERTIRFGQFDHVRKFGRDSIHDYFAGILNIPKEFDATESFPISILKDSNIPENHWRGFHIGTVLNLKRQDMLLLK